MYILIVLIMYFWNLEFLVLDSENQRAEVSVLKHLILLVRRENGELRHERQICGPPVPGSMKTTVQMILGSCRTDRDQQASQQHN